jgi:sulfite exporter TauE/SafE
MSPGIAAAALGLGLLGSVHCAAMCGGLAAAFAFGIPHDATLVTRARLLGLLSAGRIAGYALAGTIAGTFGFALMTLLGATGAAVLRGLAGVALLAIAATIAGVGRAPLVLERLGARVWQRLRPSAAVLQRGSGSWHTLALGFLWGWLPCGLVYSALGLAATAGGPLAAALVMASFGIGTLPGVLLPAAASVRLGRVTHAATSRRVAAMLLAAFGVWTLVGAGNMLHAARAGVPCHAVADPAAPTG